MNITIVGRHIETSNSFQEYISKNLKGLMDKYSIDPLEINVIVSKPGYEFKCDIYSHVVKGCYIRCSGSSKDSYNVIDSTLLLLEKRLKKYKNRLKEKNSSSMKFSKEGINSYIINNQNDEDLNYDDDNDSKDEDKKASPIIAEIDSEIPSISLTEATVLFDLSNDDCFVFRSPVKNTINILHRRKDGNIGWIEVPN